MKCEFCKEKTHLPLNCKNCTLSLCIKCYAPEKHTCAKIDIFISKLKLEHTDKLHSNLCKSDKIENRI